MTMFERIAKQNQVLALQKAFLKGEIKEEELTMEQKKALEKLFDEQIEEINHRNLMLKRKMISKLKKDKVFVKMFQEYHRGGITREKLNDTQKARIDFVYAFAKEGPL